MFTPIETKDGSSTFYSETFGEWFHNKNGARNEAQTTYVDASELAERAKADSLKILDVCYGLGYNTAAALETVWNVNPSCHVEIMALEIDIEVARSAIAQDLTRHYPSPVQQTLQQLAYHQTVDATIPHNLSAQILLGDARQTIQTLIEQHWQADIIFFDPFSPPHCPQLWTVEFLQKVAQCLEPKQGVLVTYSCAAAVRAALQLANFSIGSIHTNGRRWPGTIACLSDRELPTLSLQEQEHLQTRAAVPYRDATLAGSAKEILEKRSHSQTTSPLNPTKPWRQRWQRLMNPSAYLVNAQWLSHQLAEQSSDQANKRNLVIIDTRFALSAPTAGYEQYLSGHIPGAHYLDLNQDLSSPVQTHGGRHPLPNWDTFTAKLNQLGIHSSAPNGPTQIVIYDDSRFAFAARLWWMLRYLGHEQVSILDGGIQAWKAAGFSLEQDIPPKQTGSFQPQPQSDWIVNIETLRQRKESSEVIVIDSRAPERWRGEVEPIDPIAGSVPGSVNSFWKNISTENGQLKTTTEIAEHWSDIDSQKEVIVYCGSGVTACVNLFSMVMAGHPMHKLYPGGWSDWCSYLAESANED